ncbi:MAG: helix-turn-helix domain-containing protein [Deltaproteobacteria bacterium]|jgi:putative transposase|nr:helix-turn-helix domain-containing protein [Deltaproteobacteria bacterium]
MANRAFVFRMYPDRRQEDLIARTFGCCRFVWNRMLTERGSTAS